MIGCDGIFERLNNRDCIDAIWDRITEQINISNKMGVGEGSYKGGKLSLIHISEPTRPY